MSQKPRSHRSSAKKTNTNPDETSQSRHFDDILTGSCFSIFLTVENTRARKAQNRIPAPPINEAALLEIYEGMEKQDNLVDALIPVAFKKGTRTLPWQVVLSLFALH
jgi:ribosome assembly protein YihI (activator of Der GTPase)